MNVKSVFRVAYPILLGSLLGLAFKNIDSISAVLCTGIFVLGWVSWYESGKTRWFDALIAGTLCFFVACSWCTSVVAYYFSLSLSAALAISLLVALTVGFQWLFVHIIYVGISQKLLGTLGLRLPLAWFASLTFIPAVFPWNLASTLGAWNDAQQVADIGGAIFVDFVVLWGAVLLVRSVLLFRRSNRSLAIRYGVVTALLLTSICTYGHLRRVHFETLESSAPSLSVGVVQPVFDAKEHFKKEYAQRDLAQLRELSTELLEGREVDLLIWPESSVIYNYWSDEEQIVLGSFRDPLLNRSSPILFGTQVQLRESGDAARFFNAMLLLNERGLIDGRYYKQQLFPFTEALPFTSLTEQFWTGGGSSFDMLAGKQQGGIDLLAVSSHSSISPAFAGLICYEDMTSSPLLRTWNHSYLRPPNFLVGISNGSWFLDSIATLQHHAIASLRAIEFRRPLVRVGVNSVTGMVNSSGVKLQALPRRQRQSGVFQVPVLSESSIFAQYGTLLELIVGVLIAIMVAYNFFNSFCLRAK